jgi:predicted RNA-binding protein with RPS1 domain
MGDLIPVKLISIDDQGRLKLSRKAALAEIDKAEKGQETEKAEKKQADQKN